MAGERHQVVALAALWRGRGVARPNIRRVGVARELAYLSMALSEHELDRRVSRALVYILAGFGILAFQRFSGFGVFSAISLIGLGAILASVASYRSDPGLWMLAILFGTAFLGITLIVEWQTALDRFRGAPPLTWRDAVDFAIGLRCQWLIVRAMAAVVPYNRGLTRQ